MITTLDTSVLLDIFLPDPLSHDESLKALEGAYPKGRLVIAEPVYAELSGPFTSRSKLDSILEESGIEVESLGRDAAYAAGQAFRHYRKTGGRRERIITDFLIGSHAIERASCLISRDRGFYRSHFKKLTVINPSV
jgi:predicted nucleic acid-binding protein